MAQHNLCEKLIAKLINAVEDKNDMKEAVNFLGCHLRTTLFKCLDESVQVEKEAEKTDLLKIESIIDYVDDEMNIGHWSEIPLELRKVYTVASFVKMIFLLKFHKNSINIEILKDVLKCIDRGLLLGAPLKNNPVLLTDSATVLSKFTLTYFSSIETCRQAKGDFDSENVSNNQFFFNSIQAQEICSSSLPSLEYFNNAFFINQKPVKLKDCIEHWPARTKWKDLNYLLETAGLRTVPVEIGKQYVDENWSQKLMTIGEFIDNYYLNKEDAIGYLAQHNLFDQIPELRNDICIPEYCSVSKDYENYCEPDINCWFGPAGTVSSLHYDPKNNLLAQVYGTKQILLFPPEDTEVLYPYEGNLLNNTSQVDPMIPDLDLYPDFKKAKMYKCLLKEGEILYIPEKWWHHVIALEKSFSVSFWWQ